MTKEDQMEKFHRNLPAYKALQRDSVTAWIDPDGNPYIVPLFLHLNFFADNPDLFPAIAADLEVFRNADGNIRMDGIKMAEFMDRIYSVGWGRIGTFGGDKLELDCASEHLRSLRRKAKNIANYTMRTFVCNVTEPGQKPKRKHKALARDAYWSSLRLGFVGWLSPTGDLYETAPDAPFSTFLDDDTLIPEIMPELIQAQSEDRLRQSSEFLEDIMGSDIDGHVQWHLFYEVPYNPKDIDFDDMASLVLQQGWGRLSIRNEGEIELDTTEEGSEHLVTVLGRVVEPVGLEISVTTKEFVKGAVRGI